MWIQAIIKGLISSLGLKRKLSAVFQTLALIITGIPQLAPFAPVLSSIAAWLGLTGVVHAIVAYKTTKFPPIATIAAFFNALVLVADQIPFLAPYKAIFTLIASLLSVFSTATGLSLAASK